MRSGGSPIRRQEPLGRRTESLASRTCFSGVRRSHIGNYGDKAIVLLFARAFPRIKRVESNLVNFSCQYFLYIIAHLLHWTICTWMAHLRLSWNLDRRVNIYRPSLTDIQALVAEESVPYAPEARHCYPMDDLENDKRINCPGAGQYIRTATWRSPDYPYEDWSISSLLSIGALQC